MNWFIDFITNPFMITAGSSWLIAQVIKTIIHTIIYKKIDFTRLFGDGGMPSGHSATVTSLAIFAGLEYTFGSFQFAVCAILAIVVCHDAMGVRLETGKQAIMINELVNAFEVFSKNDLPEVKLKEFVGHTPIQVITGMIIGVANAFLMYTVLL